MGFLGLRFFRFWVLGFFEVLGLKLLEVFEDFGLWGFEVFDVSEVCFLSR